jgi:beta-glucosidase
MTFPKGFIWGAATSAYQVEGAVAAEGRGPSIWDMFCRRPGAVAQNNSGDRACEHYHRYREDVRLMKELGLQAYRFSISWPRVLPAGTGPVNAAGLDFYERLVDLLLAAGIAPWVTLYHWDYPLALHERGGWLHPDSPDWFAGYAAAVVDRLSDRVRHWFTFNEPQIFIGLGYQDGSHAPGDRLAFGKVLRIGHHVLCSHGKAVQTIRSRAKAKACIGYALAPGPVPVPASLRDEDVRAAREVFSSIAEKNCMNSSWWTDPVVFGRYPEDGLNLFEKEMPVFSNSDMSTICQPLDFLGLNVYFGKTYRAGPDGLPEAVPLAAGHVRTSFDWPVMPESLYWAARFYGERYRLPLVISENGMANRDAPGADGAVHDAQRIDFLQSYLRALRRACAEGAEVRGYFLWSLMDNFEWAAGYSQRFGIVYVDYQTQQRILKDSALWYRGVIESNGGRL